MVHQSPFAISWCGLLCIVCSLSVPAQAADSGQPTTLSVMTYNIRYLNKGDGEDVWQNRREAVCATIQRAEVVGLQEVVKEQLADVQAATQAYEWYAVGREDGKLAGESCAIGWRTERFEAVDRGTFWLSPTPEQVGSQGWDAALPRIASWVRLQDKQTGQRLLFVNTHFDHRGAQARQEAARLIRRWATKNRGEMPLVLTGDLNATRNAAPLEELLSESAELLPLQDARDLAAKPDPGPKTTWNGFAEAAGDRRIDFILISPGIQVEAVETLNPKTAAGRFASDHLPVWARIRIGE